MLRDLRPHNISAKWPTKRIQPRGYRLYEKDARYPQHHDESPAAFSLSYPGFSFARSAT